MAVCRRSVLEKTEGVGAYADKNRCLQLYHFMSHALNFNDTNEH
jgi:hypothetical protein